MSGPRGIRVDRDGTLVFADPIGASIGRIARNGAVSTVWRGSPLQEPKDIAIDRDGGYLIADFPGFESRRGARILKLSRKGRMETLHDGPPLIWPHGIAVDPQGNVIIADHECCIYRMDGKDAPETDPGWTRTLGELLGQAPALALDSGNGHHFWFAMDPIQGEALAASC